MTRSHTLLTVGFCAILVGSVLTPFVVVDARATVDGSSGGPAASDINGATQQATSGTVDYARAATTSCDTITLSESSPTQISTSGCYYITNSVSNATTSVVLDIAASDVRVFGFNETIDGDNDGIGVRVGNSLTNVTVRNLTLTDWTTAISVESSDSLVANATVANAGTGIEILGGSNVVENTAVRSGSTGISLAGIGNTARRVRVSGSSGIGIQATSDENTIENSYVADTGSDGIYTPGLGNVVRDVRVRGTSSDGITLEGLDSYAENVSIDDTTNHGFNILGDNTTVRRSTVSNADAHGVVASNLNGALVSNVTLESIGGSGVEFGSVTGSAINNTYVGQAGVDGIVISASNGNVVKNSHVEETLASGGGDIGLEIADSNSNSVENVTVANSLAGVNLVDAVGNDLTDLTFSGTYLAINIFASAGDTYSNSISSVEAFNTAASFESDASPGTRTYDNSVTDLYAEPGTAVDVTGARNVTVTALGDTSLEPFFENEGAIGPALFVANRSDQSYLNFSVNYSENDADAVVEDTLRVARNRTISVGDGTLNYFEVFTGENTLDTAANEVSANVTRFDASGNNILEPVGQTEQSFAFPDSAVDTGRATHTFGTAYLNASGGSVDSVYAEFPDELADNLTVLNATLTDIDGTDISGGGLTKGNLLTNPPTYIHDGPDGDGVDETIRIDISPPASVNEAFVAVAVNVTYQTAGQSFDVQRYIDDSEEGSLRGPDTWETISVRENSTDTVQPATATEGSTSTHEITVDYPEMTVDGDRDLVDVELDGLPASEISIDDVSLAEVRGNDFLLGPVAYDDITDAGDTDPETNAVETAFSFRTLGGGSSTFGVEPRIEATITPSSTGTVNLSREITDSGGNSLPSEQFTNIIVDSDSNTQEATREPNIGVNPDDISYGEVVINESVTESFEISNTGSATLDITGVEIETGDEDSFSLGPAPSSLAPDESANVSATFTPEDTTVLSAEVEIRNSDTLRTVELSGFGVDSDLTLNRTGIDFGELAEGETRREAVTIRNDGSANLTLTGLSITGSHEADFAVDGARDVL